LGQQLSFLVHTAQPQAAGAQHQGDGVRLRSRWKRLPVTAVIVAAILGIGLLHQVTPLTSFHWQEIFQHLYYLPVVLAALLFGWRAGLAAAILAGLSYLPHIVAAWQENPGYAMDQVIEIPFFSLAGVLTGVFSERERRQRRDLQRTTAQLAAVYRELQDNFERMKRAERLFAVGQLSAGLAHEIRNPLASIAGAVGLIERNGGSEGMRTECITIIKKENERLNRLLTRFLDFARPRTPRYLTIDIEPVLDAVIDLANHAIVGKAIGLRKEIESDLAPLECDPEQLKQVLLNLVMNAIQAMPEGGDVAISARLEREKLLIRVKDEGCGIKPDQRDKIFDPFFTTKADGTGLGLSVAHQIVEQHGGLLTAEQNAVKGMTFSLLLPRSREKLS
jgi:two-component system sensor histidine kinase HydH